MRRLGHADCGIYAEVIAGGAIGVGDAIAVEHRTGVSGDPQLDLPWPESRHRSRSDWRARQFGIT